MSDDDARYEARLQRLLAAVHAPADEAILARARARILAARTNEAPAWLGWFAHPAAVAAAALLCVACGVASVEMWDGAAASGLGGARTENATIVGTLLGDDGSDGLPVVATSTTAVETADSERVR